MELRHLRYFVAMAEEGSLTQAAGRRLHPGDRLETLAETRTFPTRRFSPRWHREFSEQTRKRCAGQPKCGNALQQPFDGHGSRLATFDDRLNDVRRKIAKSQKPADIGVVELELPGDLRRIGIFAARPAIFRNST
jgi:hypothetical protein